MRLELKDGENGYDVVGEYIRRYWKHHSVESVIVWLDISYDGKEWDDTKEVAYPDGYNDIMFDFDWWEGQKHIILYGIKGISEIEVEGGIYEG